MTLPPGPRMPRALQTLGWITRPMPFVLRAILARQRLRPARPRSERGAEVMVEGAAR